MSCDIAALVAVAQLYFGIATSPIGGVGLTTTECDPCSCGGMDTAACYSHLAAEARAREERDARNAAVIDACAEELEE